jgi:urease accessory protein
MIISKKIRKIDLRKQEAADILWLHWYETSKRILHKQTVKGKNITLRFLDQDPMLEEGDVLLEDDDTIIAVDILPAEAIVIKPAGMPEMASLCYEIGNKHLPLFYEADTLLVPYEAPFHKYLSASGYAFSIENRKLKNALRTTVSPHGSSSGNTLFNRIMNLTKEKK